MANFIPNAAGATFLFETKTFVGAGAATSINFTPAHVPKAIFRVYVVNTDLNIYTPDAMILNSDGSDDAVTAGTGYIFRKNGASNFILTGNYNNGANYKIVFEYAY